jgi:hypothetical protein
MSDDSAMTTRNKPPVPPKPEDFGYYCPSRQKCNIGYSPCMTRLIGRTL